MKKITTYQEFDQEMQQLKERVRRLRNEGWDNDGVRCYLIGCVTAGAGKDWGSAYTPEQLKELFDLGFEEVQSNETQTT